MEYNVKIGSGEILEGSVFGKIHFHFNKNGLVVYIPDTEQYFSKKNINGISFKTTIRDKIKKGSSLAKTAAFMAAANRKNKNIGQQIAVSQRFADMGRDSVVQEEIKICIINIISLGDLVIDFGSSSDIQKKLVKAYNNPKSFFVQSVKDQKFEKKVKNNFLNIIKWLFFWPYLLIFKLIVFIEKKLIFGPEPKKESKSELEDFENSEEYKKILKNLS